jgi:hypothetical protein
MTIHATRRGRLMLAAIGAAAAPSAQWATARPLLLRAVAAYLVR